MQRDDAFEFGCEIGTVFRLALGEGVLFRQMGMRHVIDA